MGGAKIYCDASYKNGKASIGVYIQNVCSITRKIEAKDSNHAERLAIMWAMRISHQRGILGTVFSDSKISVSKINGEGNSGSKTIKAIKQIMRNKGFKVCWMSREKHKMKVVDGISRRINQPLSINH